MRLIKVVFSINFSSKIFGRFFEKILPASCNTNLIDWKTKISKVSSQPILIPCSFRRNLIPFAWGFCMEMFGFLLEFCPFPLLSLCLSLVDVEQEIWELNLKTTNKVYRKTSVVMATWIGKHMDLWQAMLGYFAHNLFACFFFAEPTADHFSFCHSSLIFPIKVTIDCSLVDT